MVASCFKFRAEWQTDKTSRASSNIRKPEERAAYVLGKERGVWSLFLWRDEPSESISRFSSWPCPSHSVKQADIKSQCWIRSCFIQLSFENRVTTRLSEKERQTLCKKHTTQLIYWGTISQRFLEWNHTVHNHLLKALFLPDLVSLRVKVTGHKCRSHLTRL